jgi:hypothetical protein
MADDIRVEIEGVDEFNAGVRTLSGKIDDAADRAFQGVADQVAGQLRGSLPHRTGRLAASVSGAGTLGGAEVEMGAGVPYAEYVEYGGRGFPHSATGNFLYPAGTAAEPLLVKAGTNAADAEIASMSWPSPS